VAAAAAAGVAMIRSGLQTVDAQAKLAQSLGTTVASIQTLERAGELAGVSMSGIEQATKDLTRRLSQAAAGTGPAADALAPRDRELLTLVATRPTGLPESALVDLQRRLGVQPGASVRWLDRLIAQGWIERHLEDDEPRIDLPAPDLDWITHHVNRLTPGRTS